MSDSETSHPSPSDDNSSENKRTEAEAPGFWNQKIGVGTIIVLIVLKLIRWTLNNNNRNK